MARAVIYGLVGLIVLVFAALIAVSFLGEPLLRWSLDPGRPFAEFAPPPAPDYGDEAAWAALPGREDFADFFPPSGVPVQNEEDRPADVFFIHPTTFWSNAGWNGPIDDALSAARVDEGVMKHQASAFNACCRIYAPRYRQATMYYALAQNDDSWAAADLAYGDVRRAFRHYLETWNAGRPFILASHSQGTRHLLRLIEEEVANRPLTDRLVAVYAVGLGVPVEKMGANLGGIGICETPEETGCLVSWTTIGEGGADTRYREQKIRDANGGYGENGDRARVCVNPLSWRADEEIADTDGPTALAFVGGRDPLPAPAKAVTRAQCRDGALYIPVPAAPGFAERVFPNTDYHVYDYNLFYTSIADNASARVNVFQNRLPTNHGATPNRPEIP